MNYHDFDIWIDELREDHYPIRAEWPEAHGQASGKLRLDADSLARNLKRFDEEVTDREFAKSFGKELYEAIFQEQIATLYQLSLGEVLRNPNEGLRIRLRIRPPKLAAMPWEILYDGRHFLATSRKTLLTRYIDLLAPINELETPLPIGVLIVIPEGSGLDTKGEKAGVVKALKELGEVVYFKVLEENVTRSAIRKELRNGKYHVFHFIGHGKYDEAHQGYLVLTSETNPDGDLIDAESFRLFFTDYKHIKLVLLNSCEGAQVSDTKPFAGMAPHGFQDTSGYFVTPSDTRFEGLT